LLKNFARTNARTRPQSEKSRIFGSMLCPNAGPLRSSEAMERKRVATVDLGVMLTHNGIVDVLHIVEMKTVHTRYGRGYAMWRGGAARREYRCHRSVTSMYA
jgi:hypothetical protein